VLTKERKLTDAIIAHPAAEYRRRFERHADTTKPYELSFRYSTILRVQPSGKKTLWCQHGRGKRTKLGDAGVITLKRAEHVARQILNEVSDYGRPLKGGLKKSTLGGFVEGVYAPWLKANRRRVDKTLADVRRCFKSLWDTRLTDIDRSTLDEYVETRNAAGVSAATIRRELNNLQRIMTLALSRGPYIREHPFRGWERPKVEDGGAPRYLDDAEEARLRKALTGRDEGGKRERATANAWRRERSYDPLPEMQHYVDHLTPMVLVSLGTGLRYGELAGLEWQHVNMNFKVLTVTAATAKGQKTRHVPMNDEVLDVLKKWKEQGGGKGLVFKNADGARIGTVKTAWLALLKEAKIEGFRWHDLRHSFASKLVQRGASLAVVRDLLGHGDFKLTLRYAHINERQKTDAVALLQDAAPKPAESGKRGDPARKRKARP
jgi:site-specific recombinase XerD